MVLLSGLWGVVSHERGTPVVVLRSIFHHTTTTPQPGAEPYTLNPQLSTPNTKRQNLNTQDSTKIEHLINDEFHDETLIIYKLGSNEFYFTESLLVILK